MSWYYYLAAIPVFSLLVLVHEFGHFITAKWAGIRVEEFGLGFPPALVSIRKRDRGGWEVFWLGRSRDEELTGKQTPFTGTSGGVSTFDPAATHHTIYSLNLLPIGGFVRMPGENGDVHDPDGNYDPQSFAAKSAGKRIIVLVAGVIMNFLLAMGLFIFAYSTMGEPISRSFIGTVVAKSPAALAGLKPDDQIIAVNGNPVHLFDDLVTQVNQAIMVTHQQSGVVPIHLTVQRTGVPAPIDIVVDARVNPPAGQGHLGISASDTRIAYNRVPIWEAPWKGIVQTFNVLHVFFDQIRQMIVGTAPVQLAGPVGIFQITGEVAQNTATTGWWPILGLTAVLSLNLAIINILPFPALDGGRILLILIELLRGGKRLKPEREGIINLVGMAILLTLMVVITVSDISHMVAK